MNERKIILRNVRIRYPSIVSAKENKFNPNGKKFFSAMFVLAETDTENRNNIIAKIREAFLEKFGADKADRLMKAASENKNTRGLQHDTDNGYWYINAKRAEERGAPKVFSRDKQEIVDPLDYPQGGDYVDAVVQAWCYDSNGSKGVSFELVSLRFREKGEPFPGQGLKADADDFETLADDAQAANDDAYNQSSYL